MAFCKFCGTQLPEDGAFCPNCGKKKGEPVTPQPNTQNMQPNNYQTNDYPNQQFISNMPYQAVPAQQKKNKLPFVIAGVAVIVILFFLLKGGTIGGGNYETPIKYFCEAMSEASISKLYKALPPAFEEYVSAAFGLFGMDDEDLLDELGLLSGAGMSVKYDIISKEPLSAEELEEYSEDLSSSYMKEMKVKDGYMLYIRFIVNGEEETDYIPVGKIDGRWCIIEDIF